MRLAARVLLRWAAGLHSCSMVGALLTSVGCVSGFAACMALDWTVDLAAQARAADVDLGKVDLVLAAECVWLQELVSFSTPNSPPPPPPPSHLPQWGTLSQSREETHAWQRMTMQSELHLTLQYTCAHNWGRFLAASHVGFAWMDLPSTRTCLSTRRRCTNT